MPQTPTQTASSIAPQTASHIVAADRPTLSHSSSVRAFDALLGSAAFYHVADRDWIRITGEDRVRWLNGMVTNSVPSLAPGVGNYNFILNAQGQIQGDAAIFARPAELLLQTGSDQVTTLLPLLDRFIIMDDVELAPAPSGRRGLGVAGPQAALLLEQLGLEAASLPELTLTSASWREFNLDLIHAHSPSVPRFEIWGDEALITELDHAFTGHPVERADRESLAWLRTLEGTPRFGTDIRGRELPQETAQTNALHFSKGCYLGQEIVERIRSRGKVHRTFSGFVLEGTLPSSGAILLSAGKPIGELTTVSDIPPCAHVPRGARLALGYLRREVIDQHRPITFDGGSATASPLPFPLPGIQT